MPGNTADGTSTVSLAIMSDKCESASTLASGCKKSSTDIKLQIAVENDYEFDDIRANPQTTRRTDETADKSPTKKRPTDDPTDGLNDDFGRLNFDETTTLTAQSDDDETRSTQQTKSTCCAHETGRSRGLFFRLVIAL